MRLTRLASLMAVAVALATSSVARADFDYTVSPSAGFQTTSGAGTLNPGPAVSGVGLTTSDVVLANPTFSTTAAGNVSFNFSYDVAIFSPSTGGANTSVPAMFTFAGTIAGPASPSSSMLRVTSFAPVGATSQTLNGELFTVSLVSGSGNPPGATAPQVGTNGAGSLLIHITEGAVGPAVPEPASIALLGLGGLGAALLFRRRKVQA